MLFGANGDNRVDRHRAARRDLTCRLSSDQSLLENGADRTGS